MFHLKVVWVAIVLSAAASAWAQPGQIPQRRSDTGVDGVIGGVVATQDGTIPLAGVRISVHDSSDLEVAVAFTGADGRFRTPPLPEGRYAVTAALDGFALVKASAAVTSARPVTVVFELPLAPVNQTVDVVAPAAVVSVADTIASVERIDSNETEQLTGTTGLGSALRLLASVIQVPGGVSIKGGRPTQAGFQMGASTLTDPALGLVHLTLPDDAIDSVAVMPNPYAVEYGRFSSGLVVIQTRRGSDTWHVRLTNMAPAMRSKRHEELFSVTGIAGWAPNVSVGGPVKKDKVFLAETVQYRYSSDDISSRPENERRTTQWLSSFTRVDANVSPKHSITATGGFFPGVVDQSSLGTFTPPPATVDLHERVAHVTGTERALWSDRLIAESTVQVRGYRGEVEPQGSAPMEVFPDTTLGNFYNHQLRTPKTFQFIQTLSGATTGSMGLHLYKVGADVLANNYDGQSESHPLLILRPDGTLARRLDFTAPTSQTLRTTDVALFAQDRVQPAARWYAEFGARLDRDGIIGQWNLTPRVGTALLLDKNRDTTLRGGYGLFYERTPSAAGVLDQFETFTDARFAADGSMPIGAPVRFTYATASPLEAARSATWDVSLDRRVNKSLSFRLAVLDRRGSHELIVNPVARGPLGSLVVSSAGRSQYDDIEFGVHASRGSRFDLNATYVRAHAEGDLNAFANFFDTMMWPVVAPNQYGPLATDVPHRLLARSRVLPTPAWIVAAAADWRSGLPYSIVNESLDFVGPRNTLRMPAYFRLDLRLDHRFRIGHVHPWLGVHVNNALNSFLPSDVQANIASPAFGSLYNSPYREFRLQLRFER